MTGRLVLLLLLLIPVLAAPARAGEATALSLNVDRGVAINLPEPASSVFIANPDVADIQVMSPTAVMVFGKKTGQTTLLATDKAGHTLAYRTVIVTQDLSDLRRELDAAIPDNHIELRSLPDGIVLTGEAHDPTAVEDAQKIAARYIDKDGSVINRIKVVGSNQVMIRVRFAEVARSVDNSFGINWGSMGSFGGFVFGLAQGTALSTLTGANSSNLTALNNERPNNSTLALPNNGIAISHQGARTNVNALIDALEQDGLATILAEPNLTAQSGETADFLAGGEFPIPIPQANGTISIEFKDYGISLSFTPTIVGESRINLHVKPEVSQLTTTGAVTLDNITVPALTTRKAETTVELGSGESFAIAGLIDNNQAQTVNKYPFIGDLPILGPLFRSTEFQNDQTELVVIITPYIVRGVKGGASAMALPTDGEVPPNEAERLLGMRQSSSNPDARPISGAPIAARINPPAPVLPAGEPTAVVPGGFSLPADAPPTPVPTSTNLHLAPLPDEGNSSGNGDNGGSNNGGNDNDIAPAPKAVPVAPVTAPRATDGFVVE